MRARVSKENITEDLVNEFIELYSEDELPDPDVYPIQLWYKYKLFLLDKGIYGIRIESEETTSRSEDPGVSD